MILSKIHPRHVPGASVVLRRGKRVFLCAVLAVFGLGPVQSAMAQFEKGNEDFAAGRFDDAVRDYEAVVAKGDYSANLFYNLGNAYFRMGDFGRSILNYERALDLQPRQPEAAANLRVARERARGLELPPNAWEKWVEPLTPKQLTLTAATAAWIFFFSLAGSWRARRRRTGLIFLSLLAALTAIAGAGALYLRENGNRGSALAIVTGKMVEARVATADNAGRVLTLPAGSEIRILSQRGDWTYAALPNQLRGWIPASAAERVRL